MTQQTLITPLSPVLLNPRWAAELGSLRQRQEQMLEDNLDWWIKHLPAGSGSFYGSVDCFNHPDPAAEIGVVMVSRILWSFSSAYQHSPDARYQQMAARAFDLLLNSFADQRYGGVYWSLDASLKPVHTRKQIYGQAFCIYACSSFFRICPDPRVLDFAQQLFTLTEKHSRDSVQGGYVEAFDENWGPLADLRLSDKDENERKTMNTHLHLVEAYAALYTVWPDPLLRERIQELLHLFLDYWIDPVQGHLRLFMTDQWEDRSGLVSFGHDIEAAWLLPACAQAIDDAALQGSLNRLVPLITDAALRGWDAQAGGCWYEYQPAAEVLIREKHWWPQAEALVGLLHAYTVTGNEKYLQYLVDTQGFIERFLVDTEKGEWHWGVDDQGKPMDKEKAGFWKCPYHTTRAALELSERITRLLSADSND